MNDRARGEVQRLISSTGVSRIANAFTSRGFEIRLVGGIVRDILIGRAYSDIDFATTAKPDEMVQLLNDEGIHVVETGLKHGTVTAVLNHIPYEITTLRVDTETDGRHATVVFTNDWKLDAERRDLTINALSMDLNANVYDYFNGIEHLAQRKIVFVGDADKRMQEDYLRILRYFRFYGRFASPPITDTDTLNAIARNAAGLLHISGERIWSEFSRILSHESGSEMVRGMMRCTVTQYMGLQSLTSDDPVVLLSNVRKYTDNAVTLACTLIRDAETLEHIITRWHLSNNEKALATFLVRHRDIPITIETAQNMLVEDAHIQHVTELLAYQQQGDALQFIKEWPVPPFPLTGKMLMKLGVAAGRHMGDILRCVKDRWIQSRFTLSEDEMVKLALALAPPPSEHDKSKHKSK